MWTRSWAWTISNSSCCHRFDYLLDRTVLLGAELLTIQVQRCLVSCFLLRNQSGISFRRKLLDDVISCSCSVALMLDQQSAESEMRNERMRRSYCCCSWMQSIDTATVPSCAQPIGNICPRFGTFWNSKLSRQTRARTGNSGQSRIRRNPRNPSVADRISSLSHKK